MLRRCWVVGAALALLATGCADDPTEAGAPSSVLASSNDPVETGGLIWAADAVVHLSDGTSVDLGAPVRGFVVAGDGVFFFPAGSEDEVGQVGIDEEEVSLATPDGTVTDTGLVWMTRSLRASPDGRYLAGIDIGSGEEDRYGTPVAETVVVDLETGEEVVRSAEAMGDLDEEDLAVLYENVEVDVAAMTDDTAFVQAVTGVLAFDLATGEGSQLPEGEEPPTPPAAPDAGESPDGRWTVVPGRRLRHRLVAVDGTTLVPRTGTDRWLLDRWLDDRTVVGTAVEGPGRGARIDPRDRTALLSCVVPSGACDVVEASSGKRVVFPLGASHMGGIVFQRGEQP